YQILQEMPPPPPPPPSFQEAMDLPEWWDSFKAFCGTEYSTENPDFLDAVRNGEDPQTVFDTYVRAGSQREVNISSATRGAVTAAFEGGTADGNVFNTAYAEIVKMSSGDSWRRFLA